MKWSEIWKVVNDLILPHIGRVILNITLFSIVGIIISIFLIVFLFKKQFLKRNNKIYEIVIKLIYIPGIIIVCVSFFAQIGLARGIYKVIKKEEKSIVTGVYNKTVKQFFESDEKKEKFINDIKSNLVSNNDVESSISENLKKSTVSDDNKNDFSDFLTNKYNEQIISAVLFGMCKVAKIQTDKKLTYSDFENLSDKIKIASPQEIESTITLVLINKIHRLLFKQFLSIVTSLLLTCLIILLIPFVEYGIYYFIVLKKKKNN